MKKILLTGLILALITTACGPTPEEMLRGNWKAIAIIEEDSTLQIDISTVRFSFDQNGRYNYNGNLNYREAGTYYVEQQYLYTTDTTRNATETKAVELHFLSPDSLFIKMKDNDKNRELRCIRID